MARAPAALRTVATVAARAVRSAGAPRPGDRIAVAVSGGADSLALLHALRVLAGPRRWDLVVLTVDHGLREGSAEDASFVADQAKQLGLEVRVLTLTVADLASHRRQGPEGAARAARYEALHSAAAEAGAAWIATGHTQDDQAETLLLQLLRGTGPDGMAAMAPVNGKVVRPLLGVPRSATIACCAALGLEPRADPTNGLDAFLRNAVRREVLPLLERLRPGAGAALARAAELARADREWLERLAEQTLDGMLRPGPKGAAQGAGGTALVAADLAVLPEALARRVVRAAVVRAGLPVPSLAVTTQILGLASDNPPPGSPRTVSWAGGASAVRCEDTVAFG